VLEIAQTHFGLAPGPQLRLHAADGRAFVAAARARGERFDAVLVDAFDDEGIPPALFDEGFLRDVAAVLAPDGVFLANTFVASASQGRETALTATVFGRLLDLRVHQAGRSGGNRLLVAAADPARLPTPQALLSAWPQQRNALARIGIDERFRSRLRFADAQGQPLRASDHQPDQRRGQAGGQQPGQH
jgi:spermidine synthase